MFYEIFKNIFFTEHLQATASGYDRADNTDEELVVCFHYVLQNEHLLWPPESCSDTVKIFDTLMEYN